MSRIANELDMTEDHIRICDGRKKYRLIRLDSTQKKQILREYYYNLVKLRNVKDLNNWRVLNGNKSFLNKD